MAVEMCKLSLWLVSLDRDLPFSFVDDKVFLGNSLLGLTSLDQLRTLHIDPRDGPNRRDCSTIFDVDIDAIIQQGRRPPARLATEIDENDPARTSAAKRRQLAQLARAHGRSPHDRRRCGRGGPRARWQAGTGARRGVREPADRREGRLPGSAVRAIHRSSTSLIEARTHADRANRLRALAAAPLGARSARRDRRTRRLRRGRRQSAVPWRPEDSPAPWVTNVRDWLVNVSRRWREGQRRSWSPTSCCARSRACSSDGHARADRDEHGRSGRHARGRAGSAGRTTGFTITRAIQSASVAGGECEP